MGWLVSSYSTDRLIEIDRQTVLIAILLGLTILLGVGLRGYGLDVHSLWYDEGFSVYLASMDLSEITARTAADIQPPLYYYLLHGWIALFGDGQIALRSLSALFGILTIPLMYAVAVKLFRSKLAGLLSALLFAISPLHIWYGQEVRMYTLLTFLCLLPSYLLLLAISAKREWEIPILWAAYTAANVAALYTHYFAFFVLAFQAVYVLAVLVSQRFRTLHLILGSLASAIATVLLYLPWLPYLFTRYGTDTSYWPGKLKIHEIFIDIAVFFAGGESVTESIGIVLAIGCGLVFILCLFILVAEAARAAQPAAEGEFAFLPVSYFPLLFVLLYLLLPLSLILAVSYNSPKFNARYVMVSHPALLLIVAGGLAALWQRRSGYLGNVLRGALSALALILLLGMSAYANHNAYTDPTFARADFRSVALYVRQHIGPDEICPETLHRRA